MGLEKRVPPLILFGVALQESGMMFNTKRSGNLLPWPWTLNVKGAPMRFENRAAAEHQLVSILAKGIMLVDIGSMQVCWRYHKERFTHEREALDPYSNLRAGADILVEEFRASGDWFTAVGRYHSPQNSVRAKQYATAAFRRIGLLDHA